MSGWSPRRRLGYAAAATALAFAAVNLYWALGGRAGLSTLGGAIEALARARDPFIIGVNWAAAVLKAAGGVLALALVQPWGRRLPRGPLVATSRVAAAVLSLYGAVQTASILLILLGVVVPAQPVTTTVLWWRLLLWEPWFLVWGALLGATAWRVPPHAPDRGRVPAGAHAIGDLGDRPVTATDDGRTRA